VGRDDDPRAGVDQPAQRGHRRLHPAVVGDGGAVQGDVEVGADQDALAAQVAEVVDRLHA
jgi:hypothetical protein